MGAASVIEAESEILEAGDHRHDAVEEVPGVAAPAVEVVMDEVFLGLPGVGQEVVPFGEVDHRIVDPPSIIAEGHR